ncbi:hypothetical protein K435DRAFT_716754 [Dendrothele bispora CBS 962.96]|uniref:PIN domain-containing protein n=1 Tax=Dendrothele bispora (strain CBS 962.96) TaxID=1314807 RepID=A0A4S8MK79_DENBC|nr:hypothetical protein K435DRAFT_716754 [Dendrothele bispora CBS 962.96]
MAVAESKIAMSRALGAAFLSHQVEQLEKSVSNGAASGNWRDRKYGPGNTTYNSAPMSKRQPNSPNKPTNSNRRRGGDNQSNESAVDQGSRRRSNSDSEKDADVVVVDASVLIHSISSLKRWSRNGREEVVIVPLEALNTLDLLKKGNNSLAQKARAASRILEAQVGTNPRIRVQRDEAYVLWDKIKFNESSAEDKPAAASYGSPEWVRRVISCAQWEVNNAASTAPKVVIAICTSVTASPQASALRLPDESAPMTPVPLPAPSHHSHTNKHEPRTAGAHVAYWANKAGIKILEVKPAPPMPSHANSNSQSHSGNARSSSEDERPKRILPRNRGPNNDKLRGGLVERSPAVLAMMEMVQRPEHKVVRVLARGEKLDPDT